MMAFIHISEEINCNSNLLERSISISIVTALSNQTVEARRNVGPRAPRFQRTIRGNSAFFSLNNASLRLHMMDEVPNVASDAFAVPLCGHKRKIEQVEAGNAKKARANKYNIENG